VIGPIAWISIAVAIALVAFLVAFYLKWMLATKRRTGSVGLLQRSRLTCPKCGQTFDYDWAPGAAITALRLGSSRYMACPLCHKWSAFDIKSTIVERTED
jgi:hypothetical protein